MNKTDFPFPNAQWIWAGKYDSKEANATFEFERELHWRGGESVSVAITADSRYRLSINGEWIMDGPARGYPDYGFYDEKKISDHLKIGANRISITVVHFGVDTFQYRRGEPGLLAAFYSDSAEPPLLITDERWKVRRAIEWTQRVPRISCQLGFEEHFDARVPHGGWEQASVNEKAKRSLQPRTTGLLSRELKSISAPIRTEAIHSLRQGWSIPLRWHLSPFPKGSNLHGMAGVLASQLQCAESLQLRIHLLGPISCGFIDGRRIEFQTDQDLRSCDLSLTPGAHLFTIGICTEYDHGTELAIGYESTSAVEWKCPLPYGLTVWASTGPLWRNDLDTNCFLDGKDASRGFSGSFVPPFGGAFLSRKEELQQQVLSLAEKPVMEKFSALAPDDFSSADAYLSLRTDRVEKGMSAEAPSSECGVRQLFDLGEMTIGFFTMEIEAPAGTVIDGYFFEHLQKERLQYMHQYDGISYRNSFRYIARGGRQTFFSRQRRGFRYMQLVFRNGPVQVHRLGVIESTYASKQRGSFHCSDERLNRIYATSQRTLLLCMEDTFTDCPSYEQVFWVGDAKNEALFSQYAFGAFDLAEHSLRVAALSLQQLPLVASQCPSGWDVIIPSFSFLWGIAVWETYWLSGNADFLRELYPALKANVNTALRYCTDRGLFSAPAWNFFDWTAIDQDRETVLHNSILLAAALDGAAHAAQAIGFTDDHDFFVSQRKQLIVAINQLWAIPAGAYRDAILPDGSLSAGICQHTSFLALLYGVVEESHRAQALENCLHPSEKMTRVGSPNALFFLLEALLKSDCAAETLAQLRETWGGMLDAGATTFWEMINQRNSEFPTRSRCHGWSSSPVYLLPQLFFRIECVEPGWRKVVLRPQSLGLDFACAEVCTPHGLLKMEWHRGPDGKLKTTVQAPSEISVSVESSL